MRANFTKTSPKLHLSFTQRHVPGGTVSSRKQDCQLLKRKEERTMRTCKGQQKRTRRVTWICAVALAALLLAGPPGRAEETGGTLLQAGLYAEQVHGELDKAIGLYQRILDEFPTDRRAAAKALLHIGLCKEKLGRQEALEAYQNVVSQYPEQQNEVSVAKERIAEISKTLADTAEQPTFQKIEIASKPQNGVLSPDGNQLAFISDGTLWTVPLHGKVDPDIAGEPVRLAEVPGIWDNGSLMAWSANGEWIAVNTWPDAEDVFVHVIPAAGGKPRVVRMPKRGSHSWSYRLSLSPDGQMLAFSALELRKPRQKTSDKADRYICTIPTAGGEPKQVSSGWGRMPSFSPDGETIAYVDAVRREEKERVPLGGELWTVRSEGGTPVKLASVEGRLRGPVWSPDGKYIAAHHEPGTTNDSKEIWVFPLSPDASSAGEPEKIALPYSSWNMLAGWTPKGQLGVFLAPEAHHACYTVLASGGRATQITPESTLPYYPRWSPDGERIYFRGVGSQNALLSYVPAAGGKVGTVPLQTTERLVSSVPGGGHNISPDGKRIVVSASHDIWTIRLDDGLLTRLTNDDSHEAYPCWSPDGRWVAFIDEVNYAIYIVPAGGGEIRQVSSESDRVRGSGAITFSPDGKRIAFFSGGSIKTIPVEGGEPTILVGKVKSGYHSQLAYSPDGSKIAHNAAGKIWITQLDGGKPEELQTGLPEGARLSDFGWSPDGEKIAFVGTIGGESEFWLVSNFLPKTAVAGAEATTVRRIGDSADRTQLRREEAVQGAGLLGPIRAPGPAESDASVRL
jgi:Tol biopolymer transport system component